MLLVEEHLKRDFLDIYSTTFYKACNFGKTSAMRAIFFLNIQSLISISKMQKQIEKFFLFLG